MTYEFIMHTGNYLQTCLIFTTTNIILSWIFNVTDQRCHHRVRQSNISGFFIFLQQAGISSDPGSPKESQSASLKTSELNFTECTVGNLSLATKYYN